MILVPIADRDPARVLYHRLLESGLGGGTPSLVLGDGPKTCQPVCRPTKMRSVTVSTSEYETLLSELVSGEAVLRHALVGVDPRDVARRPASDRWSILECVEHVAIAEAYLYGQLEAAEPAATPIVHPGRERRIRQRGADRSVRVPAPKVAEPTGRYTTVDDALAAFIACRAQTTAYASERTNDLRTLVTTHPIIGLVNLYEMLLLMAVHPRRHAAQIDEIKQSL